MIYLNAGKIVAPGIVVHDNVINNSPELIELALSKPEQWSDSRVASGSPEGEVVKNIRNTRVFDASSSFKNDDPWYFSSKTIWQYANQYAIKFNFGFSNMEPAQMLHYSTDDGFYKPHSDSGPLHPRVFSAVLYLNDVHEGGETYFNHFDLSVSPKEGRLVIFPANYIYQHEARTPKSNDKFCLVTWFKE